MTSRSSTLKSRASKPTRSKTSWWEEVIAPVVRGFDVTPRYPLGTRFLKKFPEGRYEGCIISFASSCEGEFYEIFYAQVGASEVIDASGFDEVEIVYIPSIAAQRRPIQDRDNMHAPAPSSSSSFSSSSSLSSSFEEAPTCPVCFEEYSPFSKSCISLPIQSSSCDHHMCKDCVEIIRINTFFDNVAQLD